MSWFNRLTASTITALFVQRITVIGHRIMTTAILRMIAFVRNAGCTLASMTGRGVIPD